MEEYLITLPRLCIDGLWYSSPYIELTEMSYNILRQPNNTIYGLAAAVFTKDLNHAVTMAQELNSGQLLQRAQPQCTIWWIEAKWDWARARAICVG